MNEALLQNIVDVFQIEGRSTVVTGDIGRHMKSLQQTLLLLGILFALLSTSVAKAAQPPEPVYQGKPLGTWLEEYEKGAPGLHYDGDLQMLTNAQQAIIKVGTNALPWLLFELSAKEATRGEDLPTNFSSGEAIKRRWRAVPAFPILGISAKSATPNLVELLKDKQTSYTAATALKGIGADSIPILIQALTDKHACARESAARVLGLYGTNAQSAIPAMIKCATETNASVRSFATFSLGQIGKEPEIVLPVLIKNLGAADRSTRLNAVIALSKFGSEAKQAAPALLKAMQQNDDEFKRWAKDALQRITREGNEKR